MYYKKKWKDRGKQQLVCIQDTYQQINFYESKYWQAYQNVDFYVSTKQNFLTVDIMTVNILTVDTLMASQINLLDFEDNITNATSL